MANSRGGYDVAVIGAGFAGVVAARDLSVEGHSVVHLEARDRIGGRAHTGEAFGRPLEFGGAYVHWTQPHIWRELRRHRIPLVPPLATDTVHWLADGAVHTGSRLDYGNAVGPLMARCFADARERFPLPFDLAATDTTAIEKETLADRLDALHLSAYDRDLLDGGLAALVHDHRRHGVAQLLLGVATYFGDWSAFFETASLWPIEGGTRRLLDAVAAESRADLRLATPVTAVEDDGAGVTVTTRDGRRIRARAAVVAVPLNALGDVTLTPQPAPPARDMIERKLPMRTVKIWARVRGEIEPFCAFAPLGKNPVNAARVEYRHQGDTLLMCLASDASAISADDREAVQRALRTFVLDLDVRETAGHDWANDPFSQGTWAMHRPGDLTGAVPRLREPLGRLRFAGGDIAALEAGSIEGAMASGARAARDIAAALLDGSC
ncbi:flavin monoamine oxidase family protein [Streptomyces sp. NPDC090442]|uniref:flavin monoamine oxidase family protein n=1 Tax=Streptomyces sp. NPDC090442 TaxID=3365962 RepID=UPI003814A713